MGTGPGPSPSAARVHDSGGSGASSAPKKKGRAWARPFSAFVRTDVRSFAPPQNDSVNPAVSAQLFAFEPWMLSPVASCTSNLPT